MSLVSYVVFEKASTVARFEIASCTTTVVTAVARLSLSSMRSSFQSRCSDINSVTGKLRRLKVHAEVAMKVQSMLVSVPRNRLVAAKEYVIF